jgi:flagellar biosynthetic protein FliR
MDVLRLNPELMLLSFMRVSGFVFTAPIFGSRMIPTLIKVWFSVFFAFALMPMITFHAPLPSFASGGYLVLAAREVILGILMGLVSSFFIYGVEFAGHLAGFQMGFMASTAFDPVSSIQASVTGRFQGMLALTLFLVMNGHHMLISSFASSYRVVPPAIAGFAGRAGTELVNASMTVFSVALKISVPILIALFIAHLAIAMLGKTMRSMNVFTIGFPVKIALGLTIIGLSMPYFAFVISKAIAATNSDLARVLHAISGGQ